MASSEEHFAANEATLLSLADSSGKFHWRSYRSLEFNSWMDVTASLSSRVQPHNISGSTPMRLIQAKGGERNVEVGEPRDQLKKDSRRQPIVYAPKNKATS